MASRSLGLLTLNLVAKTAGFTKGMSKAERDSDQWRKTVERNVKIVSAATTAGAAAAGYALMGMTRRYIENATEIQRLSQIANTSTQDFQRMAVGAEALGFAHDKLADILKDVNDKVGEFVQTGGGPLIDFFENIAPKVGVTAEAFKNLSGADALGLYVKSLQEAGLTQQEMTFYMEALGNDSTALLPLLQDNAQALNAMADAAEAVGVVISDETLLAANQLDAEMDLLKQQADGLTNQFMSGFVPSLRDAAAGLLFMKDGESAAVEGGKVLGNMLSWLLKIVGGAYTAFVMLGKAVGAAMASLQVFYEAVGDAYTAGVGSLNEWLREHSDVWKKADNTVTGFLNNSTGLDWSLNKEKIEKAKAGLAGFADKMEAIQSGLSDSLDESVTTFTKFSETVEGSNVTVSEGVKAYIEAREELTKLGKKQSDYIRDAAKGGKAAKKAAASRKAEAAAMREQKEAIRALNDLLGHYASLNRELMTDDERRNATLKERIALLDEMQKLLNDPQRRKAAGITDNMVPALQNEINKNRARAMKDAMNDHTSAIEQSGFDKAIRRIATDMGTLDDVIENGTVNTFNAAADAIANFAATGKLNIRELAVSVLQDLSKMLMKFAVMKAVMGMFGMTNIGGYAVETPTLANGLMSYPGYAKGGAFSNGLQFFAKGGVVNRPTAFGMAGGKTGIMGEAGEEAIMPLARGRDGKLGVRLNGGGNGSQEITINQTTIINADGSSESDADGAQQVANMIKMIVADTLQTEMRPGGRLNNAIKKIK